MNFKELQQAEDAAMGESLTKAGFRRAGAGVWNRQRGVELNVVELQEHSNKSSFCVNLGIHYAFLPKAAIEAPLDPDLIKTSECEINLRLTDRDTTKDQWWPIAALSIDQIAHLVRTRSFLNFDMYRLNGPISEVDIGNIENGNFGILSSISPVRACLLLARMHEYFGDNDKCIEIATFGIKIAGMAVGPKKALKDILKRLGSPV